LVINPLQWRLQEIKKGDLDAMDQGYRGVLQIVVEHHEGADMDLSDQERQFLAKRIRLVRAWKYVGVVLIVGLTGLWVSLFWFVPLLANPFEVMTRLNADSIPPSTMALSTALLPIIFLTCFLLALVIVLFTFASFSNERNYLVIIQKKNGYRRIN